MGSRQLLQLISLALLLVTAKLEPANPNVPPHHDPPPSLGFPANPYPSSPPPSSSSSSPIPVKPNNPPPTPAPTPIKSYAPAPTPSTTVPSSPPPARSTFAPPQAPAPYHAPSPMMPPTVSPPGKSPAPSPLGGYFAAPPPYSAKPPVRSVEDCEPLCTARCRLHSRQGLCMRACSTCCARCKCVPPGTFGNREVCGKCYTDMRTHGNKPKCP